MSNMEKSCSAAELKARIVALETALDALKELLNERETTNKERLGALKTSIETALAAADKALVKADQATEKRFDSVNEFRQTLQDQALQFLPRGEYSAEFKALTEKVSDALTKIAEIETKGIGRSSGIGSIGTIVLGTLIGVGALAALGVLILNIINLSRGAQG